MAHFFFLAAFFWLNTMCFNIWWTFRWVVIYFPSLLCFQETNVLSSMKCILMQDAHLCTTRYLETSITKHSCERLSGRQLEGYPRGTPYHEYLKLRNWQFSILWRVVKLRHCLRRVIGIFWMPLYLMTLSIKMFKNEREKNSLKQYGHSSRRSVA